MRVGLLVILLLTVGIANASVVSVPRIIYSNGTLYRNSSFTVPIYVSNNFKHVPMDIVIVIDNSPSMNRYGNVIAGSPDTYVNLGVGGKGTYVCTFSINSTTNVELVLQTLLTLRYDVGNRSDAFRAYLVNNSTSIRIKNTTVSSWGGKSALGDPALVRWYNLSPGRYDVYASAKGGGKFVNTTRVVMVELPPERIVIAKTLAEMFVGIVNSYDRVAVVNFSSNATTLLDLTSDKTVLNSTIDNITAIPWPAPKKGGGGPKWKSVVYNLTNLSDGLRLAIRELDEYGRSEAIKAIIVLTDGWSNTGGDPVYWARVARSKGYHVYTVGIGGVNSSILREIASVGGGKYYDANSTNLNAVYSDLIHDIEVMPKDVRIGITFTNSTYITSSPLPLSSLSTYVTKVWDLGNLTTNRTLNVTVVPEKAGKGVLIGLGNVSYATSLGEVYAERFLVFMNVSSTNSPTNQTNNTNNSNERHWLRLIPDKFNYTVLEGNLLRVNVTINASDPQDVTLDAPVILPTPIEGTLNDVCMYSFRRVDIGKAVFYFTPFYNFTEAYKANDNVTIFVKLLAEDTTHGLKSNSTLIIKVLDVNAQTYPKPEVKALGKLKPHYYVGEPIPLSFIFINATDGYVYVNGMEIWHSTFNSANMSVDVMFVPNTAGTYVPKAKAINATTGEEHELVLPPIEILIKPVSP